MMKPILASILFFYLINLNANYKYNDSHTIKCKEITGTGRSDIFRIKNPSFKWYYKGKWYELANSEEGVAKDWQVNFFKNVVTLYNKKTEWNRRIDLDKMTAAMQFSTGEEYLYNCSSIDK